MVFRVPLSPDCDSVIHWASQGAHSSSTSVVNVNWTPRGIKLKKNITLGLKEPGDILTGISTLAK